MFITTKIHPRHLGYQQTLDAFSSSLRNFRTDVIDLLLLHYPQCWGTLCSAQPVGSWRDSWRAMKRLVEQGKVLNIGAHSVTHVTNCVTSTPQSVPGRTVGTLCEDEHRPVFPVLAQRKDQIRSAAGVSNFGMEQLVELLEWSEVPPAVVQRRSDLFTQDLAMQRFCLSHGIKYTAYSSLGTQYRASSSPVLKNGAVVRIAQKHNASPAQVRPCSANAYAVTPCCDTVDGSISRKKTVVCPVPVHCWFARCGKLV